jgi:hypothetical protein
MGTKVLVRATRSFNGRIDGEWYWVDPDNPHERALIDGGYYAHQEALPINVPIEPLPPDPEFAAKVAEVVARPAKRGGRARGQVEAAPGQHHPDSAG